MSDVTGIDSYNLCTTGEVAKTLQAERSDNEHLPCVIVGGGWCIGNGQLHDALQIEMEVCKTLNCMCDPMKILVIYEDIQSDKPECGL